MIQLGVNIDHVATLRNARDTVYPSPLEAALLAETHGADAITLHLREDRRHIVDADVFAIKQALKTRMNLEMALTREMLQTALDIVPHSVCIVPEKRAEVTTEGGLDVIQHKTEVTDFTNVLQQKNIRVSLFIDADLSQVQAAYDAGANVIELHTGAYAETFNEPDEAQELAKIEEAAYFASELGLEVHAGHGLTVQNVKKVAQLLPISELNIGHALIAQALFLGLPAAILQMKEAIFRARHSI